jgi:hypothetical protein
MFLLRTSSFLDWTGGALLTVALAVALAVAAPPAAAETADPRLPIEYLPVGHPAYDDIEALAAMGLLRGVSIYTRPLSRSDVARALVRSAQGHYTSQPNLERLKRELARELADLGRPPDEPESPLLIDTWERERRARVSLAGHLRGDYDEKRDGIHFRLRDESSLTLRGTFQLFPAFAAYEEFGVTRIRSQRIFIDAIALNSDLETTVLRAGITARSGPLHAAFGYDRFRWGPGRRGTLLLSDAAGPITYLTLGGSFSGWLTTTALSGVLSRAEDRYLAAHRIEAAVTPRLSIGLAEAVRYRSDGIDLLYASGLLPYAVVERTHIRDASTDSVHNLERANIMVSMDVVGRLSDDLTVYGELLLDDIATENRDMPDRLGYQIGLRSSRRYSTWVVHLLGEYARIRRFTYATEYGQNFVHRGRSLGHALGPDVEAVWMEVALDFSRDWQARWSSEFVNQGEGYLGEAWTTPMGGVDNAGLYGVVEERREVWGDLRWIPRDQLDVTLGVGFRRIENEHHLEGATRHGWLARLALDARY